MDDGLEGHPPRPEPHGLVRWPPVGRASKLGAGDLVLVHLRNVGDEIAHRPSGTRGNGGGQLSFRRGGKARSVGGHVLDVGPVLHRPSIDAFRESVPRSSISGAGAQGSGAAYSFPPRTARRKRGLEHPRSVRAEREVVPFPIERVDAWARFDTFVEEEHERLFKALYFVTGSREDAEDLSQEAFMKLWERRDKIEEIEDPTGYLFRVALNGFRMRRRRAAMALRRRVPLPEARDEFVEAEMRADVRHLLMGLTPRQRAT